MVDLSYSGGLLNPTSPNSRSKPTLILVNLIARQGRRSLPALREFSKSLDAPLVAYRESEEIRSKLDALPRGSLVWVAGGDGTLSRAAPLLIERGLTLGILPLGTGNSLARELNVPLRFDRAVEFHLNTSTPRQIDVGEVNGQLFLNAVSIGVSTGIAGAIKALPKHRFGNWVYLPGVLRALRVTKPISMVVEAGQKRFEGQVIQFVAASTRNHGGKFAVSPEAAIDDGLLSIYAVQPERRSTIVRYAIGLILGRQTNMGEVWNCEAAQVSVTVSRPRRFVVDGDLLPNQQQVSIGILPGALRVLAAESS